MGRPYILVDTQLSARISSFLVGGLVVAVSKIGLHDYLTSNALSSKCGGTLSVLFMDTTWMRLLYLSRLHQRTRHSAALQFF